MTVDFEQGGLYALQAALDAVAEHGGQVIVPPGEHLTAGIVMPSQTELHLMPGAILRFTDDPAAYPIIRTRWEGWEQESYRPLIYAKDAERIAVTGQGTLEGSGERWWKAFRAKELPAARPCFVCFENCRDVRISDVRVQNSPAWTLHPLFCENVRIDGVTIINPADSPNTDGIDPESCRCVRITNCHIDVGDDCIAIKAGTERADAPHACEDVAVVGCTMVHGHGGVVLGSEMSGSIRRVSVQGCVFDGTDRGIRIKSRRGRGGAVEDLLVSGVVMHDVLCPLVVNLMYFCGPGGDAPEVSSEARLPVTDATPHVRRIQLSDLLVTGARSAAGSLCGLPEAPLEDICLRGVTIDLVEAEPEKPVMNARATAVTRSGLTARHVRGLTLDHVKIRNAAGETVMLEDCQAEA